MYRRPISLLLVFVMLFSLTIPVSASSADVSALVLDGDIILTDHTVETQLSPGQAKAYEIYEIAIPTDSSIERSNVSTKDFILQHCTQVDFQIIGGHPIYTYSSDSLGEYLYNFQEFVEISMIDSYVYVYYITQDGTEVNLSYSDSGLASKVVYHPEVDTAILDFEDGVTQCEGFRAGCSEVVSDRLLDEIARFTVEENWEALEQIENEAGIDLFLDNSGPSISPYISGFTSDSALLSNLKSDFPYIDARRNSTTLTGYGGIPVSVYVREIRNGYTKKTSDWKTFLALTAIQVIGTYLSLGNSLVMDLLNSLSIAISVDDQIQSSVTLHRSAVYRFQYCRNGYAWDNGWNDYVHVIWNENYGEFTGGYDSSGNFTWVMSLIPSPYDISYSSIAQQNQHQSCQQPQQKRQHKAHQRAYAQLPGGKALLPADHERQR